MSRRGTVTTTLAALAALAPGAALAERIELRDGDVTISAPAEIDCAAPPDFALENAGALLFAPDRGRLDGLVSQMAAGLAAACADVDRVTVTGTERGVAFSFEVTREDGWRLDGPVASAPAPEPAPTPAAAPAPAETPAAEPEPEAPARPEIAPGLDFATFTSIFGSVPTVRGHVAFDNSEIWSRVLAARMFAQTPGILDNDTHAVELLGQLATQPEYLQVLGPLAGRRPEQMSVFERRDIAERIRTQLRAGLDQRRQTGPILVYNAVQLRLGEYDFTSQSFPLPNISGVRNHRQVAWKNARIQNAFGGVVLPERLRATQEQARQLDAYLRNRNDPTLYLAIFAEIDPEMPRSLSDRYGGQPPATNTRVTQVALFADRGLSQVLYDFTADLGPAQAEADIAAAALTEGLSSGEDVVRAIDEINGSIATSAALAEVYVRSDYGQSGESAEARRAAALAILAAASPERSMRLAGTVQLGTYDPVRKVLPVTYANFQGLRFDALEANAGLRMDFLPPLSEIPVDAETAGRIAAATRNGQIEVRLEADLVQGSHQAHGGDYIEIAAILRPKSLQLFDGADRTGLAPRRMVLDLELPESVSVVPSLMDALTPQQ